MTRRTWKGSIDFSEAAVDNSGIVDFILDGVVRTESVVAVLGTEPRQPAGAQLGKDEVDVVVVVVAAAAADAAFGPDRRDVDADALAHPERRRLRLNGKRWRCCRHGFEVLFDFRQVRAGQGVEQRQVR